MLDPSTIVNLFAKITDSTPGTCSDPGGLDFMVPPGKAFLLTDLVPLDPLSSNNIEIALWTDARGELFKIKLIQAINVGGGGGPVVNPLNLRSPIVINSGETLCLSQQNGSGHLVVSVLLSGRLVDA